jgi:hypothetical protein
VSCQIGKDKCDVPAPKTVKSYNAYTQGINHHDLLQVMLSLRKQHGFKKWYVKLWLALIDISLTYANIFYFLANQELKKKGGQFIGRARRGI